MTRAVRRLGASARNDPSPSARNRRVDDDRKDHDLTDKLAHMPDWYGHAETRHRQEPVWTDGSPIPWMSYPAIAYLEQLDFSDRQVFEYGAGNSTRFWAARARVVISVEHDPAWRAQVASDLPSNAELLEREGGEAYAQSVVHRSPHDVIIVDGRWRYDCSMACPPHLAPGGMIILDNAERFPAITRHFRALGFLQIDMIGHGPQNLYHWATSVFLSRDADFRPRRPIQPRMLPGMTDSIEVRPHYREGNKAGSFQ